MLPFDLRPAAATQRHERAAAAAAAPAPAMPPPPSPRGLPQGAATAALARLSASAAALSAATGVPLDAPAPPASADADAADIAAVDRFLRALLAREARPPPAAAALNRLALPRTEGDATAAGIVRPLDGRRLVDTDVIAVGDDVMGKVDGVEYVRVDTDEELDLDEGEYDALRRSGKGKRSRRDGRGDGPAAALPGSAGRDRGQAGGPLSPPMAGRTVGSTASGTGLTGSTAVAASPPRRTRKSSIISVRYVDNGSGAFARSASAATGTSSTSTNMLTLNSSGTDSSGAASSRNAASRGRPEGGDAPPQAAASEEGGVGFRGGVSAAGVGAVPEGSAALPTLQLQRAPPSKLQLAHSAANSYATTVGSASRLSLDASAELTGDALLQNRLHVDYAVVFARNSSARLGRGGGGGGPQAGGGGGGYGALTSSADQHWADGGSDGRSPVCRAADDLFLPGDIRTRWRLGKVIARGGSSTVLYATRVPAARRPRSNLGPAPSGEPECAAVKVLAKESPTYHEKLVCREVFTHRLLTLAGGNSHIADVYEVWEDEKNVFIVMELLQGGELFHRISLTGPYTEKHAANLVVSMLDALSFCHRLNITHRDVKPENFVFLSPDKLGSGSGGWGQGPNLKLIDFGISHYTEDPSAMCRTLCGTPLYLAPEVFFRQPYGPEADMWALGVIVYIMLVGYPPFDDDDLVLLVRKIKFQPVAFDPFHFGNISAEAKDFLACLLDKDASNRMSAQQALEHDWLRNSCRAASEARLDGVQSSLKQFVVVTGDASPPQPSSPPPPSYPPPDSWADPSAPVTTNPSVTASDVLVGYADDSSSSDDESRRLAQGSTSRQEPAPAGAVRTRTSRSRTRPRSPAATATPAAATVAHTKAAARRLGRRPPTASNGGSGKSGLGRKTAGGAGEVRNPPSSSRGPAIAVNLESRTGGVESHDALPPGQVRVGTPSQNASAAFVPVGRGGGGGGGGGGGAADGDQGELSPPTSAEGSGPLGLSSNRSVATAGGHHLSDFTVASIGPSALLTAGNDGPASEKHSREGLAIDAAKESDDTSLMTRRAASDFVYPTQSDLFSSSRLLRRLRGNEPRSAGSDFHDEASARSSSRLAEFLFGRPGSTGGRECGRGDGRFPGGSMHIAPGPDLGVRSLRWRRRRPQ